LGAVDTSIDPLLVTTSKELNISVFSKNRVTVSF
jgi:hypothetical protein